MYRRLKTRKKNKVIVLFTRFYNILLTLCKLWNVPVNLSYADNQSCNASLDSLYVP